MKEGIRKSGRLRDCGRRVGGVGIVHMKYVCGCFAVFLTGLWLNSCAPTGGGMMGDMGSGDDGSVGGISEVPNPSAAMAKKSGKPLSQLQRGHEVYMLKCGECHAYQLPERVDIMDWEDVMPKMISHAGLPKSDEKAVLDYVIAVKKEKGKEY
jgi:hypothetical protein